MQAGNSSQNAQDGDNEAIIAVLTNLPDACTVAKLSRALLEARVCACVNRLAPVESEYWWQGKLEQATEWPLLAKTTREQYSAVEAVIRANHPYDVPEIIAWPVSQGFGPYLAWVRGEVTRPEQRKD
ncbi:divalent-cation tolerance protein CutA [Cupriavidus pinatubonensis]|uniref:Divalent-cation tolerance protein CutA n=1 Tax=Cupriavidus pinatubonensis TaxID=248026 RepID=A0ABM8WUP0_9BURK|nr:divalent-cation tolerance protein CutA [Cupriavidus pinatubonensis]CAG9171215.1 Divalent-cation tolerance protein CutA [Cupriavidus pinatubonensis]